MDIDDDDTYYSVGPDGLRLEDNEQWRPDKHRSPIEEYYSLGSLPLNGRPHYQNTSNFYIYYAEYKKGKKCWIISKFFNEVNVEKRPLYVNFHDENYNCPNDGWLDHRHYPTKLRILFLPLRNESASLPRPRIPDHLINLQLTIIPHGRPVTNVTRELLIDSMAEIAIDINESNQTNPRYNTSTGRLWIHTISQIFQCFAISATTLYAFDHLDERENLPMEVLVGSRTAAIVIVDQTTQHIRTLLTDAFRFIFRRVARADGSTIFFLDELYGQFYMEILSESSATVNGKILYDRNVSKISHDKIFNFLDQVLDNETRNYLTANNIRGSVFEINPSYC